jgi:hypothetical protein
VIYFKVELDQQEMSNVTYVIPEENILLIKPEQISDEYLGVIDDMWYSEMIKNLPRQILDSLETMTRGDFYRSLQLSEQQADQRKFTGNMNFLRLP